MEYLRLFPWFCLTTSVLIPSAWAITLPTPSEMQQWKQAAQVRIENRNQVIAQVTGRTWDANESIMNRESTVEYLKSLNRLELRYPFAVPQAQRTQEEVLSALKQIDPRRKGPIGTYKKLAALRFLAQRATDDPMKSGLNSAELLSLAWAAIQDKNVFRTRMDIEDRKWGLLEALANIQRAHNDCGTDGAIEWNHRTAGDLPSCEVGKFKRLLEHLDNLHPDVRLNSQLVEQIPNQMVSDAILAAHQDLTNRIPATERRRIVESFGESLRGPPAGKLYNQYLARLSAEIRSAHPAIPMERVAEMTNRDMMEALFDMPGWEIPEPPPEPPTALPPCRVNSGNRPQNLTEQISKILTVIGSLPWRGIAAIKGRTHRIESTLSVTPEFAALGSMYQVGRVIWSGTAPRKMNQSEAVLFCSRLRARLPTRREVLRLSEAMGYSLRARYPSDSRPEMQDTAWWTAERARSFEMSLSNTGRSPTYFVRGGSPSRMTELSVRCVDYLY